MGIAVSDAHEQLAESVRRWAAREIDMQRLRKAIDGDADLPNILAPAAAQGLLSMHLPAAYGGDGYGLVELAVATEELGRALAPGALLTTAVVSAAVSLFGDDSLASTHLPGLADGSVAAALAVAPDLEISRTALGVRLAGVLPAVLAAGDADVLLLGGRDGDGEVWALVDAADVEVRPRDVLDLTRGVAEVTVAAVVDDDRVLDGLAPHAVRDVAVSVFAAEAAGIAAWCQESATEHARTREQFGRPIGQFQAVKHTCADLLVLVEQAQAAAWDAVRAVESGDPAQRTLAATVAGATAIEAAVTCALECVQILGGIGFTWEHDAHLYLRRATVLRQLLGGAATWNARVCDLALDGHRRELALDLAALADVKAARREVREFVEALPPGDGEERRAAIAESGYYRPHWPQPWGRDADPVEQLVIDEELAIAGVQRPGLVIGGWILPSIIAHGSDEQQERFVLPTLRGEITWCQMFSEPGAGSDLASLSTRAERRDGGWALTGQKVWTSLARSADWSLCLARTDPDVPKHDGITAFLVRMDAAGLDIRPLRELTGDDMFNEVFLDEVFVPDEDVLGPVNAGWEVGRTTLANERVAMSSGSSMGSGVEKTLDTVASTGAVDDPVLRDRLGALVCTGQVLSLLGFRTTLRQVSGLEPGATSSVRKLVGGLHAQDCAELALEALGPLGATTEDAAAGATHDFLQAQCLTIAGGTTAVQKNVIAERLLGLPRDRGGSGTPTPPEDDAGTEGA